MSHVSRARSIEDWSRARLASRLSGAAAATIWAEASEVTSRRDVRRPAHTTIPSEAEWTHYARTLAQWEQAVRAATVTPPPQHFRTTLARLAWQARQAYLASGGKPLSWPEIVDRVHRIRGDR